MNCNKHGHVILGSEVDVWFLGTQSCETVLGGNYTGAVKPINRD